MSDSAIEKTSKHGLQLAAKVLGVVYTPAGIANAIVEEMRDRRNAKQSRRLEALVDAIGDRLDGIEAEHLEDPPVDLLDEILATAVADEDRDKTLYYATLVEYVVRQRPEPYLVRLLTEAFRALTVYEVRAFGKFDRMQDLGAEIPEELRKAAWMRYEVLGLHPQTSSTDRVNITPIGRRFLTIATAAESGKDLP